MLEEGRILNRSAEYIGISAWIWVQLFGFKAANANSTFLLEQSMDVLLEDSATEIRA